MTGAGEHRRRTVRFAGTVQGVGFRFATERIARRFAVTGYVRNLSDGRVETAAEGAPAEIDRFLEAIDEAMAGYIRDRQVEDSPATGEFNGFRIVH
jgi:acylphosphatase